MQVEIKNLGYVEEVSIDLSKNLTVLCGHNNTGKTYIAYAVYGFLKYMDLFTPPVPLKLPQREDTFTYDLSKEHEHTTTIDVIDYIVKNNDTYLRLLSTTYFVTLIAQVFGVEKNYFKSTEIKINLDDLQETVLSKQYFYTFKYSKSDIEDVDLVIKKDTNSPLLKIEHLNIEKTEVIFDGLVASCLRGFFYSIFHPKNTYIAPAERIAVNIFAKELSLKRSALIDDILERQKDIKNPFDYISRRATRYPAPIRDSLEIAEDLANFSKQKSSFNDFADEIEREILKGQVLVSKEGEVEFIPKGTKKTKLPVHLSASVVKSLASLVIYFRHMASEGDFIIIDEPEMSLHPDNQVLMARIIAKIVNRGFKVLISTHSDYIVRELNNLIMLQAKPAFAKKYKYSADMMLDPEKIAVLLFRNDSRKAIPILVDTSGFEIETMDSVTHELNQRTQDLYFNEKP
ncbi:MAG: AAA family ATPase [Sphingobacteriales bacterium]|nr:AAA family ATPase [Sphingobacteriales bacterium]